MGTHYPSDLTDRQWQSIRPLLPASGHAWSAADLTGGEIINAILYVVRTGCQWRQLPHDFPKWKTVYTMFLALANQWALGTNPRRPVPASAAQHGQTQHAQAAIIDSQSIRTAEGGQERGFDAGKKITGRKRHLAVDTLGLVWAVVVHGAYWQDHDGACFVLMQLQATCRRLKVVFADSAYGRNELPTWVRATFGWVLQTVLRPVRAKGFVVLPKRWIVERTFAWIARHRRHARDYERNPETSEAMIYVAMIGLMSRRLARKS